MSHLNRQTVGAQAINEVFDLLKVSPKNGLSVSDARKRLKKYGPNRLREVQSRPAGKIFIDQFKSGIVVMLVVAVVLSMLFGDLVEAVAIAIVIVINGLIGFFTELKAARSMEALQELGSVDATVCRDGQIRVIPAEELVPGDLVQLDSGDVVTADIRLSEASKLQVDESSLTGESVPVSKQIEPLKKGEMPLAEQTNMVFKGTAITSGSGKGVVVTTGMQTELGHISSLVDKAEEEVTPLEKRLDSLGHGLIWLTVALAAIVAVIGLLSGREWLLMVETAIALAIAAIPEGLPIVATIALARGMHRMAKRNALMNTLSAVETLGSTTVICTDKTGTLTRNKMTMTRIVLAEREYEINNSDRPAGGAFSCDGEMVNAEEDPLLQEFLENGVLCNNAALPENSDKENGSAVGDPMEVALLAAGAKADIHRAALLETFPEEREEAFDSDTKMMATLHRGDEGLRVAVKGAAEAVLAVCTSIRTSAGERRPLDEEERDAWRDRNFQMAKQGLRLLAFATKTAASVDDEPYRDLTLLGYAGLLDPPRDDVQEAISLCQQAGIKLVMVTGDQAITAQKIGESVGMVSPEKSDHIRPGNILKPVAELSEDQQHEILNTTIFARVSPEEKLNLVTLYQNQHDIVAMTGDGVNDAPALEKADIGIAMGQHGTQVAREAADMILKDDAFSTIVEAIRYGRVIFGNIRKFVIFLLSGNAGEIMIVGLAMLLSAPLPLMPLQILYLNFIADVFPALALGVGMGTSDVMHHPPRDPKEPVMTHRHWFAITGYGVLIAAAVLTAFAIALQFLGLDQQTSVTISFLTLATARLWHVFNMRDFDAPILNNDVTRNPWVWGALGICLVLILLAVYVPALSDILRLVRPTAGQWLLIIGCSVLPLVLGQALKALKLLCRRNN